MTTIDLNGQGSPEPARRDQTIGKRGTMRGWTTALYVSGLLVTLALGEAVGWVMPWLEHAGTFLSFLGSMLVALMAAIAYVAGFRYLTMNDHHNA